VFVNYLAHTVDAAAAAAETFNPFRNHHNHGDRNNSINEDNHNYQDDGRKEDTPSPELSRKVWSDCFLLFTTQH